MFYASSQTFNKLITSSKSINTWKWRGLSLSRRIQKVKKFEILKIFYKSAVKLISQDLIKEAKAALYSFILNGKDKVKRDALISSIKKTD